MITSIVITTYNGEKYIEEQLKSILYQTKLPDEVIISDDASTDNTCGIIKRFILLNQLAKSWKLNVNAKQSGYVKNFHNTIKTSFSDVVFLCDQDDIWNKRKIELMEDIMSKYSNVNLLCCKHINFQTEKGIPKTKNYGDYEIKKVTVNDILKSWHWPGMTMCFRKKWYDRYFTGMDMQDVPHDLSLAMVAANQNCFYEFNYVGVLHRIHESNTSPSSTDINQITDNNYKIVNYCKEIEYYERLKSTYEFSHQSKEAITNKIEYTKKRIKAIYNCNILDAIKSYTTASKEIRKKKSLISDIYGILRDKTKTATDNFM